MLLKNCIYFITFLISSLSILMLIYSIKNNNQNICKSIKTISIFYIVYLILNIVVIPDVLSLDIRLEFLLLALEALFAIIINIVSIIKCSKKIKKDNKAFAFSKKSLLTILLIVLPIFLFSYSLLKEYYLITNSDLILVYKSNGNGGLDDSNYFAYAINENYFQEISLGISTGDHSLEKFLPKKAKKIDSFENINGYNILFDNNEKNITVYKNNKLIHEEHINPNYFNIDFEGGFYINHN